MWEMVSGILGGATVINEIAALLVYRYLKLASESMEFAALVISSIEEAEDGIISVNPLSLAATSMDHISQLSGLLKWVRL
ncbi:hypothetical protein KHC33_04835 [Methanospirillum sp. J.3.6.1-F.2.7.3]|uniref:Uncharacterized protein n=1 Tax=Methanospirillum purgamenti TaxID=2834276 RepID=A0A8E7B2C9_9EURY|nr:MULTISPECIES: hypothetical protein [Methanospirillum]QVV89828.1 hypothetical protein KHC33_04835 [Methanospirillum sp. J.3.6.1-F.2.7.3]